MVLAFLFSGISTAHAFGPTQCAASRFGSNLNCSANDVALNNITVNGTPPSSCVGGGTLPLDLQVTVNFQSPTRYDIGVFLSNDGNDPALTSAASCSVGILPTSGPFQNLDGDACGDGSGSVGGGTGSGSFVMTGVTVPCTTDGSGNTVLYIPYVVSWDQSSGNYCGSIADPVPGTTSKCNKGTVSFPPGTTIIVLPSISITDGRTTVRSGDALTYTIVITSSTGSTVSGAVFTDPAVPGLTVSGISCSAAGGATCPASPTVSAMQGAGIALPNMPSASTLTFTVTGTYTGTPTSPTTLTNTASVTLNGQTNSASDTDTVMVPPTVTKSFNSTAIASGGTSILTVTLTNPTTTVDITGAAFTDNYPVGMTNSATPTLTNTCGGTATAAAGGSSLSLSGATIPKGASCTVTVRVTATATGVNSTGAVTSTNAASGSSASATLQVVSATNSTLVAVPTSVPNDGVSTSTLTATLRDTAGNPVAGKTISLTAGSGSSIITVVSGVTNANGEAVFTVRDSVAESVTYTARDVTDNVTITQTATVTFSSINSFNVFESSTAAGAITGKIFTKLAGTAFSLHAVAIAGASQASGFNGNVRLELLVNTGTPGSGYDANNCPTSNTVIQTVASAAIAAGRSAVNFAAVANAYRDVRVRISYPTASPTISVCSNDSFAVRPPAFSITSTNATNTGTSGTPVIVVGANFNLTASSVAGYDGTPSIDNTAGMILGSPTAGTIGGGFSAAPPATGTATGASFSYSQVGSFGLGANTVYDSSFTGVDQPNDCTSGFSNTLAGGKYGCSTGSNAVAQTTGVSGFGRFIPHHFNVIKTHGCSTFTYSDQPFDLVIVNAMNAADDTVLSNYSGAYARNVVISDANGSAAGAFGNGTFAAGLFAGGTQTKTDVKYTFATKETEPLTIKLRATEGAGGDGVGSAGFTEETAEIRSGRVRLINVYGSELVPLSVPMRVEHYSSDGWVTNAADTCTALNGTMLDLENAVHDPAQGVATINIKVSPNMPSTVTVVSPAAGTGSLDFSAPGAGGDGHADAGMNLSAQPWLQYDWDGTAPEDNPTGRATFGLYRGSPRHIYLRERY